MTLALKASGTGSIPLASKASKRACLESKRHGIDSHCGNDFLLHSVDVRQTNIEGIMAFPGGRKDSSTRHETMEGSDGPGGSR